MEAKTEIGKRLVRWILPHEQPKYLNIDHPAVQDIAAAVDEIERMSAEIEQLKRCPAASDIDPTAGLNPNFNWDGDG